MWGGDIANEFSDFFTSVGVKIAESIEPTSVKPEDFMPLLENVQNLERLTRLMYVI